ncbi:hypothetical protein HJFPF1_08100 [Paramyrothecium foliicola]|nr:hypothetical protein HJFPF1_08100 [Paramyrothecium foliicola]
MPTLFAEGPADGPPALALNWNFEPQIQWFFQKQPAADSWAAPLFVNSIWQRAASFPASSCPAGIAFERSQSAAQTDFCGTKTICQQQQQQQQQ